MCFLINNLEFILVAKKYFPKVCNMPMFEVVCKKVTFFETIYELIITTLPRFACKANRDSESRSETASGLISTP